VSVNALEDPHAALEHRAPRLAERWRQRSAKPARITLSAGIAIIVFVLVGSLAGHFVLPAPTLQDFTATLQPPSLAHPFGTDDLGRDLLSRTASATWIDLSLAVCATFLGIGIGVVVGTGAGYLGGWLERLIMRIADFVIAFPYIVLVLAVIAIIGPGITGMFIALVSAGWAFYARVARAELLVLREQQFIQAAQTLGFSKRRVMFRHAVPNLLRPCVVYSMSDMVFNILFIAALSYLGLGVRPPTSEWGAIISDGQTYLLSAWWISTLPGLVVVLVGVGLSLIGDAMGERLGPRGEPLAK